jgi:hypothetical protein
VKRLDSEFIRRWTELRERRRLRHRVLKTLRLGSRGAACEKGLPLHRLSTRLVVEWYARDVHPWDRDLPQAQRTTRFVEESLKDTVEAIWRMFERLPEIDAIDLRVLEPNHPHKALLAGTVFREDVNAAGSCQSPAMSLKTLGVKFRLADGGLEPLS